MAKRIKNNMNLKLKKELNKRYKKEMPKECIFDPRLEKLITKMISDINTLEKQLMQNQKKLSAIEKEMKKYSPESAPTWIKGSVFFGQDQIAELESMGYTLEQYLKNLEHSLQNQSLIGALNKIK